MHKSDVKDFLCTNSAWMRPDGTLLVCDVNQHLEALCTESLYGLQATSLVDARICLHKAGSGGKHGVYDDWCRKVSDFMDSVFMSGWLRITLEGVGRQRYLEVEGIPQALDIQTERTNSCAKKAGARRIQRLELVLEPNGEQISMVTNHAYTQNFLPNT